MEALFHFAFELIKISILGSFYATLILLIFIIIGYYKSESWFARVSKKKIRLWFISGFISSVSLFCFLFSYWGNHGLGDSSLIPVGHKKQLLEIDGTRTYIKDFKNGSTLLSIDEFIVTDNFIYGLTNGNYKGKYFVFNIKSNEVKTFVEEADYMAYLKLNKINVESDYNDFSFYYEKFWKGWRFWLLA